MYTEINITHIFLVRARVSREGLVSGDLSGLMLRSCHLNPRNAVSSKLESSCPGLAT